MNSRSTERADALARSYKCPNSIPGMSLAAYPAYSEYPMGHASEKILHMRNQMCIIPRLPYEIQEESKRVCWDIQVI